MVRVGVRRDRVPFDSRWGTRRTVLLLRRRFLGRFAQLLHPVHPVHLSRLGPKERPRRALPGQGSGTFGPPRAGAAGSSPRRARGRAAPDRWPAEGAMRQGRNGQRRQGVPGVRRCGGGSREQVAAGQERGGRGLLLQAQRGGFRPCRCLRPGPRRGPGQQVLGWHPHRPPQRRAAAALGRRRGRRQPTGTLPRRAGGGQVCRIVRNLAGVCIGVCVWNRKESAPRSLGHSARGRRARVAGAPAPGGRVPQAAL